MKNFKIKEAEHLDRNLLKRIFGGFFAEIDSGTCSADCLDRHGNESTVTCSGSNCTATSHVGCSSDDESKSCPN
jgi:hypothetical protein